MERVEYFKNFKKVAKDVKNIVRKHAKAEVFVFGSVIKGDYSIGLSDIDIAIVSEEFKDRRKKLKVYDILFSRYFDSPIEFHLLTRDQWKFFLKFVKKDFMKI